MFGMDKTKDFIEKAKIIHNGENLDYSQVIYKNNRTPVKIIDHDIDENGNEYGEFWQTPYNHLKGHSHPLKRNKKISNKKSFTNEQIIEMFKKVHSDENLDYSQVQYINMHTKVKIISHDVDENGNEYGEFWQEPCVHLKGCTHPLIGRKKQSQLTTYNTDEFKEKCYKVHGKEHYNLDSVNYVNSKTKVKVFCNAENLKGEKHGYFMTSPDLFLMGKGCPICGHQLFKNENEIYEFICELVGKENVLKNDTTLLDGKELDIYVPKYKIAFEYNGLRWHSEQFGKDKNYHLNKTLNCYKKGVSLIQIFEDEYINHKDLVLDKIKQFINCNNHNKKIYARKCEIHEISNDDAKNFLNQYHIQGFAVSSLYLGAYYNNELIAVMTFKKTTTNEYELNRFSTNINYTICGIASKLFSFFVKNYNPLVVKSFLDVRWRIINKDSVYEKIGFHLEKIEEPNYYYTNGRGNRCHKFNFRKQILHKKYGLPLSMTEKEMTQKLGYYKIWNCGLIKYVWRK